MDCERGRGNPTTLISSKQEISYMKRDSRIDLIRTLSMLMVVILHVIGYGFMNYDSVQDKGSIFDLLPFSFLIPEVFSFCAVNCFAMVSGYLLYDSQFHWSRILKLYVHTGFYTVLFLLVFLLFKREAVSAGDIIFALIPILDYWYVKAYFGVLFFLPALCNLVVFFSSRLRHCIVLLGIFCFTSMLPGNIWGTGTAGCTLWLAILFIVGGVIRKNEALLRQSKWGKPKWFFLGYFLCAAGLFLICVVYRVIPDNFQRFLPDSRSILMYSSPFVTLEAVCLFIGILLSKPHEGKFQRIISRIAPYAFGVYLLHMDPFVKKYLLADVWNRLGLPQSGISVVPAVLGLSVLIFSIGIAVDYLRSLFFSFSRIDSLLQKSNRWDKVFFVAGKDHAGTDL